MRFSRRTRMAGIALVAASSLVLAACGSGDDDSSSDGDNIITVYGTNPQNPLIPTATNEVGGGDPHAASQNHFIKRYGILTCGIVPVKDSGMSALDIPVARQLIADTLGRYERERQPAVLARAEEMFREVTDGAHTGLSVVDGELEVIDRRRPVALIVADPSTRDPW